MKTKLIEPQQNCVEVYASANEENSSTLDI